MHILERRHSLNISIKTLWKYISKPENLNDITPPDLNFTIVTDVPETMYNGLMVEYRIRIPFFGIHQWVTEIKHIRENISFVDEQRLGPYKLWIHYHEIIPDGDNCIMLDRVHYKLPFGILGNIVHTLIIKNMLKKIFNYRWEKFEELFNEN